MLKGFAALTLMASPLALGLHWWLGRWLWSLSVPVLVFTAYLLLQLYVVHGVEDYATVGLIVGLVLGVPSVLVGALAGALIGRSLRVASRVHSNNPSQPTARDDARSG